jgi:transcription antitermination factor NusG
MLKKEGDVVKEGELLGKTQSFFGLFKSEYKSKLSGTIELISEVTGMVGIRELPVPINITAYISGKVVEILPKQGVVVEAPASFVQGIFGIGGEKHGELMTIADSHQELTPELLRKECEGKIVVGGSLVSAEFLKKAEAMGVKGVVTGGINRIDLAKYLGYEMGVAITGYEEIGLACIVTEGFGKMAMADHTYNLLKTLEGKHASINGATQIRAGVIRPEIVVPTKEVDGGTEDEAALSEGMLIGTQVRIIRQPYFGIIGTVASLPAELQQLESESYVRVMTVRLDDGRLATIPRANAEIMEE